MSGRERHVETMENLGSPGLSGGRWVTASCLVRCLIKNRLTVWSAKAHPCRSTSVCFVELQDLGVDRGLLGIVRMGAVSVIISIEKLWVMITHLLSSIIPWLCGVLFASF